MAETTSSGGVVNRPALPVVSDAYAFRICEGHHRSLFT